MDGGRSAPGAGAALAERAHLGAADPRSRALWRVDVRALHRLAALELGQLLQEVPPRLRRRVNRWLRRMGVVTRLE